MTKAKLLWTEHPYDAGFCVTDDTDAATFEQTRTVYDFLLQHHFLTTKTVWCFRPAEPCGIPATPDSTLRGITLEDPDYLSYCRMLNSSGYEICLHGATAGNNKRQLMIDAFERLSREFEPSDTFVCHSKNAENIYWESKVTRLFPFNLLIKRQSEHSTSGEEEGSPYFWADICRSRIKQIRLYRTRRINTLKANPSMPYHDRNKPFVNYWFSATKRRIADCARDEALGRLKAENGLIVLYQYLHRYADSETGKLNKGFVTAIERLSAEPGLRVATVAEHMDRLRMIRSIGAVKCGNRYCIINANRTPAIGLQFTIPAKSNLSMDSDEIKRIENRLVISRIEPRSSIEFGCNTSLRFKNCHYAAIKPRGHKCIRLPSGDIHVRAGRSRDETNAFPHTFFEIEYSKQGQKVRASESIPIAEEYRLITGQIAIILREILLKGRKMDSNKYLDASKSIPLEDHDNW